MTMKRQKKQKLRNAEYYHLQETFDNLYSQSSNGKTFNNLMTLILSEQNIKLAYRNMKKNDGSKTAGIDKKTIRHLEKWHEHDLIEYVRKRLSWYVPQAVRRVEIPKDNGKTRPLGIPTIIDRLIQQCILQVLEPICEAKFYDRSYGFRPNRSQEHAIAVAYSLAQIQHLQYVVDLDIKGFFDNVSHGKLLKQMWTLGIRDKKLICIISAMLKAEVAGIGFPEKGTPQGGIISPLLSNIVLNELDWWISSQWENIPMRKNYVYTRKDNGVKEKSYVYDVLRNKSNLKECYGLRFADDFKIYCRNRQDAEKIFIATKEWLKDRLGLEISPEKSKITNLKKQYSDFLGFKITLKRKGFKSKRPKYTVVSHLLDKNIRKIKSKAREIVKRIQKPANEKEEYKAIMDYNSYILGVHNYYRIATHVNYDFRIIGFSVKRAMRVRLKSRLKKSGNPLPKYMAEKYGKSRELRYVGSMPIIPVSYIQTKPPSHKKTKINSYTKEGREEIHKKLEKINMDILFYLMMFPIPSRSIEYNDNRLSLYCAQNGKCSVSGKILDVDDIRCHHKIPIKNGGTDKYSNLVIVCNDVHALIHATDESTIKEYLPKLNLKKDEIRKLNTLRKKCNLTEIVK